MNNIIYVAENKDEVLSKYAGKSISCPQCQEELFSIFDKLYIESYGKCVTCTPENEVDTASANIMEIL